MHLHKGFHKIIFIRQTNVNIPIKNNRVAQFTVYCISRKHR